jgi:predicted PurR-regulated permease PerM
MTKGTLSPNLVRQLFIIFIICVLAWLILDQILPYFSGVLAAFTLFVLFRKLMDKLEKRGWYSWLASSFILVIATLAIAVPVLLVVLMIGSKIGSPTKNFNKLVSSYETQAKGLEEKFGIDFASRIDVGSITEWLSSSFQSIANSTFDAFIAISIMYFLLYYMLINHKKMLSSMQDYIPLRSENIKEVGKEVASKVKANAIGIPLVGLFQGFVALIGFWIFGVPNPWFWFVITSIASVVPFVGTAFSVISVSIILFASGETNAGIGMLIYGFVVVNSSDNLVRLLVLKKMANEHPLITLMGVIIGLPLFGFIGLIFGPLLISLLLIVLKIYKKEFS